MNRVGTLLWSDGRKERVYTIPFFLCFLALEIEGVDWPWPSFRSAFVYDHERDGL